MKLKWMDDTGAGIRGPEGRSLGVTKGDVFELPEGPTPDGLIASGLAKRVEGEDRLGGAKKKSTEGRDDA